MKILLIIAAGNSTRMGELPKAVSLVHGTPNLYNTVDKAYRHYDKIFVSSNTKNFLLYREVLEEFDDKVQIVTINSGHGCGHAVLKTIEAIETDDKFLESIEHTSVCWGDAYFETDRIFYEITKTGYSEPIVIPVIVEDNPYVWFETYDYHKTKIANSMFSKRGESTAIGFHDQSIFKIDIQKVKNALTILDTFTYKVSTKSYLQEIIFLDLVNYFYNTNDSCRLYVTEHRTKAYNTKEELADINIKIKIK